jgi:L-alanine-DL-glutamate epimerase-like enolase superfamily enzyme
MTRREGAKAMYPTIDALRVAAYTIPTDADESDGTLAWTDTTLVLVEAEGGGKTGLGYTYAAGATAHLIAEKLAGVVTGMDAMAVPAAWEAMRHQLRNDGLTGISMMAISAVDIALWDLKARICGLALVDLLGGSVDRVPVYGSGGFTSYDDNRLAEQLGGWVDTGIRSVKMKVGREKDRDLERVRRAREAIGDDAVLMVDANGAYARKEALMFAERFAEQGVAWFEEPVSSDDLEGLRLLRDRAPSLMDITAGEYGYTTFYFHRMLEAGAVDVLQADVTRCGGITGLQHVATLCRVHNVELSAHTAPNASTHVGCSLPPFRDIEYFHDHVRIETMLFEGALTARDGFMAPDRSRHGMGLTFEHDVAERYLIFRA